MAVRCVLPCFRRARLHRHVLQAAKLSEVGRQTARAGCLQFCRVRSFSACQGGRFAHSLLVSSLCVCVGACSVRWRSWWGRAHRIPLRGAFRSRRRCSTACDRRTTEVRCLRVFRLVAMRSCAATFCKQPSWRKPNCPRCMVAYVCRVRSFSAGQGSCFAHAWLGSSRSFCWCCRSFRWRRRRGLMQQVLNFARQHPLVLALQNE